LNRHRIYCRIAPSTCTIAALTKNRNAQSICAQLRANNEYAHLDAFIRNFWQSVPFSYYYATKWIGG